MPESLLTVDQVTFAFRQTPLFRDVSLQLGAGQIIRLAGPNGAGKTTFMSLLAGLRKPNQGNISFHNQANFEYCAAEHNGLFTKMNALQNLEFWSSLRGHQQTGAFLAEQCAAWRLPSAAVRSGLAVERFSTGMKRKLALLRVALSNTKIWLLDEPISGLDEEAVSTFIQHLEHHRNHGGSCVLISHDMQPFTGKLTNTITFGDATK